MTRKSGDVRIGWGERFYIVKRTVVREVTPEMEAARLVRAQGKRERRKRRALAQIDRIVVDLHADQLPPGPLPGMILEWKDPPADLDYDQLLRDGADEMLAIERGELEPTNVVVRDVPTKRQRRLAARKGLAGTAG